MGSIVKFGRAKGYPKSRRVLEGLGSLPRITITHRDKWEIEVDDENMLVDDLWALLDHAADDNEGTLHAIGTAYPGSSPLAFIDQLRSMEQNLERDGGNRKLWHLDETYVPMSDSDAEPKTIDEITPNWGWSFESLDRVLGEDVDGNPVQNSAGQVLEYLSQIIIPVLRIDRIEEQFLPATILALVNHRNQTTFWDADGGMVWCSGIEDGKDSKLVYSGRYYRRVGYVFKFAVPFIPDILEGWTDIVLDRGTYYLDDNNGALTTPRKIHFRDDRGSEISGNLDGFGGKLAEGAELIKLRFNKFPEAEFNDYDLGPFDV